MDMKSVEDFYPLSPMQQGMLFHSLYAPESGVYFEQLSCTLRGDLETLAFERAWQRVVDRHPVLRTAFVGEGLKEPVQVVRRQVKMPIEQQDWRGLSPAEQSSRLEAFLQAERRRNFVLSEPPLMRLALFCLAEDVYQFVWSHHHLLLDGWSVPMLLQEVMALYEAFRRGDDFHPPPRRPYRDYIVWLRRQDLSRAETFWRKTLEGFIAPTPLVVGRPIEGLVGQEERYDEQDTRLSAATTAALQSLARQHGLTLSTLVQGAWALLLSRYSDEEDVVFGATVSGRPADLPESELMIGLFINTLPVRVQIASDAPVVDWLQGLQVELVQMRQYEYSPLVQIHGWSQVPRGVPLFESILVFENYPVDTAMREQEGSLTVEKLHSFEQTNYPLTVVAGPGEELLLRIVYDCRRFEADTIGRMLGHLGALLDGIAADPGGPVSALPLLTQAERPQLLATWNDTNKLYPLDGCVHELFEAQVGRQPDAIAVTFNGESLSYAELNRQANRLAHYLRKLGVGPEVLVGLCVEPSWAMVVGALGILKAGGAYVPIDPSYPEERLSFVLEDTRSPVLLTQARLTPKLPLNRVRVICLDRDWGAIAEESAQNPMSGVAVQNLAYVIYTSGSTGRPKGVQIGHAGLLNLVFWHRRVFVVSQETRATQIAGPGFDASVWEVWPYLTAGASIHIPSDEIRALPDKLRDWLVSEAITISFLPTPLAESIILLDWSSGSALQTLLTGGDKLYGYPSPKLLFELVNNYGPTEDSVVTTSGPVPAKDRADMAPSIGCPIDNTQVYVLDSHLRPVPVGVPGELHIGGVGLSRGYLDRPELTGEKFIPHPFSGEPGARLYKTGDLVRYRADGNLEFLGRIDHQVKIRGLRIELGEIEVVLRGHPAVREVAVLAWEEVDGDKRLVAYLVPDQYLAPSVSELRDFLKKKLPAYMIPSAFIMLEALPLTPNGKVDRKALPAPEPAGFGLEAAYVAPRTPEEEIVASLWAGVLGIERVGVHDNFFELGGHSLLATQLISRVRKTFQVEVPLRDLFEAPTVAGLVQRMQAARRAAAGLEVPSIKPVPRDDDLPLSFAQQRLWFLDQLEPGTSLYNIPMAVRLTGHLDVAALEQSLNEIVRRHEALHTIFLTVDGRPVLTVVPGLTIPVPVVNLAHLPEAERETEALRRAAMEAERHFDLAQGPLLRVTLLQLGEEEHIALLVMHHIVSDGWSMGILIEELAVLYDAFSSGKPSPLPELPIQYTDFGYWQRNWLQGEVLEAQFAYWRQQLAELPPLLELPADRPRSAVQSWRGATQTFDLSSGLTEKLKVLSLEEGATLFMTLLAAFQTLLYRYTGQEDISVGTPIANRNQAEIEGLIGFFVNTLVMRTDLRGEPTFREVLRRVRDVALGAYAHQDLPFEMLVDALQPERDMSHTPLFQVMFVLQNAPLKAAELPSLGLSPVEIDTGVTMFDLTLTMVENADGLIGTVTYHTDLFDAARIQRMIEHLQLLLASIVANPDQPISHLPLLTGEEQRRLLVEWNDTEVEYPLDQCVHQFFEAQVKRTPNALAVIFEGEALTYRELNRRANQLAHYLQKLGVEPEMPVGICVERSPEMIVGLLGVLKAGGAYVPLDPAYPKERLVFVQQDTQMPVLLTQEQLVRGLPRDGIKVVCLDTDWELIARQSEENPVSRVIPENLVYVIYTSGSTGKPKGVLITHRNVAHLLGSRIAYYHPSPGSFLLLSSISFDSSIPGIFGTLCQGGTLVLPQQDLERDPPQLIELIARNRISHVVCLPSLYALLLDQANPRPLVSLQTVIVAGESCSRDLIAHHYELLPHTSLFNEYGPTEGTVWCSVYKSQSEGLTTQVPIGRPVANTQIYLLDSHLQPVPVGVPGELHIGGVGLGRGYLNWPNLTAEKFIPNPFSDKPGTRLYKTGDLACYLSNGNIEFLGRTDYQVKVRGFRIELGEIEAVLGQHPALRDVVVVAREDTPGDKRLVAYVVLREKPAPTIKELRSFLKERLPEYMIPSAFVVLDVLPLTPNGKVNRRALPAPDQTRPDLGSAHAAPETHQEEILTNIWSNLLNIEQVGIYDNFFELGGDSILGIQVIARANQAGLRLSPKHLFQYPTIHGLAQMAGTAAVIQAEQGLVTGPVSLTPIQHWFFERHLLKPHHWNTSMFLEVWQSLDITLLEQTVKQLLRHHDTLRLRFQKTASGWQQANTGEGETLPFSSIDLSRAAPGERRTAIESTAAALQSSLNLSEGPLLRVAYFDLGPDQPSRLLMIFHHLVLDGVSWRIFIEDFQAVYRQLSRSEPVQLPLKTTSFQYWSRRLSEYAQSPEVLSELDYWVRMGTGQITPLPVDYLDGSNTYGSTENVTFSLSPDETRALLQEVPGVYGTRINDVLLTALMKAIGRWTGERRLLIELEGHGREHVLEDVDLSRTVGWFTTSFPVLLDLRDAGQTVEELQAIKEQLRAVPNRGIGYGLLRYVCADREVRKQLSIIPQPAVSFNYLGQFDQLPTPDWFPFQIATESAGPEQDPNDTRDAVLDFVGIVTGGELHLRCLYSKNLHRRSTIEKVTKDFIEELRLLIVRCLSLAGSEPALQTREMV